MSISDHCITCKLCFLPQILMEHGKAAGFGNDTVTVIAGLSNTYADYVATFAEYQVSK